MRNGLYSIHIHMLDGVKGRDSGVILLRDGQLISGGPYFWSIGSYTVGNGTWKGELATNQHTPFADAFVRPGPTTWSPKTPTKMMRKSSGRISVKKRAWRLRRIPSRS